MVDHDLDQDVTVPEEGIAPTTASTNGYVKPQRYPQDLERDVVCKSGLRYHIRPIRPDDAGRLVAFHERLSPRTVYLRFFSFHPTLSKAEVKRFTTVDYVDRLALVAVHDDNLIAVGRFDRDDETDEAEVAFVVADEYQRQGIGTLLLDELARAARQRYVHTFRAETLAENQNMLDVFRNAGFPVTSSVEYGTVTVRFPVAATDAYRAALADRETQRVPATGGP